MMFMFGSAFMNAAHGLSSLAPSGIQSSDSGGMHIEKLTPIQYKIVEQIVEAIDHLGGKNDLTVALTSWGDTLPEKDVLQMLTEWNEAAKNQPALR